MTFLSSLPKEVQTANAVNQFQIKFQIFFRKVKGFELEEKLVYQIIEEAGNKGTLYFVSASCQLACCVLETNGPSGRVWERITGD